MNNAEHEAEAGESERGAEPSKAFRLADWIVGPALGLTALAVYLGTLSPGAYPGESAALTAQATGLIPQFIPSHPLWGWLVRLLAAAPAGGLAFKANLLSALCAAGAVGLLYAVLSHTIERLIDDEATPRRMAGIAARLAGASAALFLAFCGPFWIAATRAHTSPFDTLLLLVAAWLLLKHMLSPRRLWLLLLAFLGGILVVEFTTFIVFAPLVVVAALYALHERSELNARSLWPAALCALAGLSLYLLAAGAFYGSPGYHSRGFTNYFQILRQMLRFQQGLLMHSLPREGWLIVLLTTSVPWLTGLVVARRGLNNERDWSFYLLHLLMTGIVAGVLVNAKLAPWPMLKGGQLLVTPYVLIASLFGYLVAYWFLLPASRWQEVEEGVGAWLRRWLGGLLVLPALGAVLAMPFRNAPAASGRGAKFVDEYAHAMLDSLGGRPWLVTDGTLDHHLLIAARERRQPVRLLNLRMGTNPVYMNMAAAMFDSPAMKALAQIGMMPLLDQWFRSDPEIASKLAVQAAPDLWVAAGFTAVPDRLVFLGARQPAAGDGKARLSEHQAFWVLLLSRLPTRRAQPDLEQFRRHLLRHAGMVANNLGVWLEDQGLEAEAWTAYSQARACDADNISALLNQAAMADRKLAPDQAKAAAVKRDVDALVAGLKGRYQIWSLSSYYGYVRLPQAFAQLGMTWALSGQPGLAASGLRKAMDMLPEAGRAPMKSMLASLYLAQDQPEQSEKLYSELLQKNSKDGQALLGMMRLCARRGEFEGAEGWLRKAESAGLPKTHMMVEQAALHAVRGDLARARALLEQWVELDPKYMPGWDLLVTVLTLQKDEEGLAKCALRLRKVKGVREGVLARAEGQLALLRGDMDTARDSFSRILAANPRNIQALEALARLDVAQGRQSDAEANARKLLTVDAGNALGNYLLGGVQLSQGNLLLAEEFLRRSLRKETTPDALNDLAWVLQMQGKFGEAEQSVRKALALREAMGGAWDTLGVILLKTGKADDAEKALERAVALVPDVPSVWVHMAEVQERKRNRARRDELLAAIEERAAYLPPEERAVVERLKGNAGR